MKTPRVSLRRKRFVWATITALSVCAVLPGTGPWARRAIIRTFAAIVRSASPSDDETDDWQARAETFRVQTERDRQAASQMPNNFPVHLADCIESLPDDSVGFEINDDGTVRVLSDTEYYPPNDRNERRNERIARKLRNLAPRFDRNPSYHAAILRYLSFAAVRLNNRGDEAILYAEKPAKGIRSQAAQAPQPAPDTVAMWHEAAQAGQRLDPQNAFFPFMEAVAFFAEHRDADALAAFHHASTKRDFNDYALEEADGITRLRAAEGAPLTAPERAMAMQNVYLPHYGILRACARLAVAKAVEAELQNRTEDGFRIRRDTRRIGAILRQSAAPIAGAQFDSSTLYYIRTRPGGAPLETLSFPTPIPENTEPVGYDLPPPPDESYLSEGESAERGENNKDKWEKAQNEHYQTYLRRIGHANEARSFAIEIAAQKKNQRLVEQTIDNPKYYFYFPRLFWLQAVPILVRLLLLNALFLLLLGGIAHRLARTRRIARDEPLPRVVRLGITSAFVLPLAGTLLVVGADELWAWAGPELSLIGALSCFGVAALVRYRLLRRARSAQNRAVYVRGPSLLTRCRAAGVKGIARTVGLWTLGAFSAGLVAAFLSFACSWFFGIALNPVGEGETSAFEFVTETAQFTTFWTLAACVLATPSLLLLFFAACSPKVGVPALAGMVRGLRGVAVPVACGFVLLTVPLFVWLACADAALNHDIDRALQNQSRYIAKISGK